jgi:glutamate synthase (NADPH/NADH) large chain
VIDNDELAKIWNINADGDLPGFGCTIIDGRYPVHGGAEALAGALERVRREASEAISGAPEFCCCPIADATKTMRRSRHCC